jgi:phosphoribosylformylglycinamidine cyclo-ligase
MVAIVSPTQAEAVVSALNASGETASLIGSIVEGPRGCTVNGPAASWNSPAEWTATHNA